jgi:nardilysin
VFYALTILHLFPQQNLMEEPVFDVLRTQEQLGYNVYATLRNTFGVLGFSITVDFQVDKFR